MHDMPFKYPVANGQTFETARALAEYHAHAHTSTDAARAQAEAALNYFGAHPNAPIHDFFRDALTAQLGYDPGADPNGDGWSPKEIRQYFGPDMDYATREWLMIHYPELYPQQTSQAYADWLHTRGW